MKTWIYSNNLNNSHCLICWYCCEIYLNSFVLNKLNIFHMAVYFPMIMTLLVHHIPYNHHVHSCYRLSACAHYFQCFLQSSGISLRGLPAWPCALSLEHWCASFPTDRTLFDIIMCVNVYLFTNILKTCTYRCIFGMN